jgi:branched-chain amino acid transport system substrate-binding protein
MKRRTFLAGGAAGVAALTAGRVSAAPLPGGFSQPLTIAVNVPLSGDLAAQGRQIATGVHAAADEANTYAGSLGRYFNVREFDDGGSLAQAMTNVQFAASDETVVATIGNLQGSLIIAALPQYAEAQMPLIVPASTAERITGLGYRNVWRLPTKDSREGALLANYVGAAKPKFVIAVTQDGDYGPDVAQGFTGQAKAIGTNADGYIFSDDKPDFPAAAKRLLDKHPDAIALCGTTAAMGPLVPELRRQGFTGTFYASQGFFNAQTTGNYADALGPSFVVSTSMPPLNRAPGSAQLLGDFRAHYGDVTALSAFGYAAAQIVIAAAKRNGATDRLATASALQAATSYDTLVGDFTFAPTGDPVDPNLYFYGIEKGGFKYLKAAHPTGFIL